MPSIFYADDRARAVAAAAPFGAAAATTVLAAIGACPEHAATPLRRLPELARAWGLREVCVKDERARLGLRSFKALGGAYAVLFLSAQLKSRECGAVISIGEMLRGANPILPGITFTAATAGNHGCSVAAGARLVGARCCIFVAAGAPAEQVRAIAAQGAQIVSVPGRYEDSLEACRLAAESNGWIAVSDCATDAHDSTVQHVMEGYTVIAAEILAAQTTPSHVFLQAGVGGMAAAALSRVAASREDRQRLRLGADSEVLVIVTEAALTAE